VAKIDHIASVDETKFIPDCLHCEKRQQEPSMRGLCIVCYYDLDVRRKYPTDTEIKNARSIKCLHCKLKLPHEIGLCVRCYKDLTIRHQYENNLVGVETPGRRKGLLHDPNPTVHPPGTPGKIAVLEERARNGYHLFHPDDATLENILEEPVLGQLAG
jgi:hypothetical protein